MGGNYWGGSFSICSSESLTYQIRYANNYTSVANTPSAITDIEWLLTGDYTLYDNCNGFDACYIGASGEPYHFFQFQVRAKNECGWGPYQTITVNTMNCGAGEEPYRPQLAGEAEEKAKDLLEAYQKGEVYVYPNPTQGLINVLLPPSATEETYQLTIADYSGKVLQQSTIDKQRETSININALPTGVYILAVKGNKYIEHKKIIKK